MQRAFWGSQLDQQESLAEFHRTISEQLNARLEESPRFFWALVAISTAYGYALWGAKSDVSDQAQREIVVRLTAILAYLATLWASWYLAALGYAFRFLQNTQHCIERALGWDHYAPPKHPPFEGRQVDRFILAIAGDLPPTRFGARSISHSCCLNVIVEMAFEYLHNCRTRGFVARWANFHRRHQPLLPQEVHQKVAKPRDDRTPQEMSIGQDENDGRDGIQFTYVLFESLSESRQRLEFVKLGRILEHQNLEKLPRRSSEPSRSYLRTAPQ